MPKKKKKFFGVSSEIYTLERWRDKKTGRFVSPRSKGSYRLQGYALRHAKGTPAGGRFRKGAVKLYSKRELSKELKELKTFDYTKKKGTLLRKYIGDWKIGKKVVGTQTQFIQIAFKGTIKGKRYADKLMIAFPKGGTVEYVQHEILSRVLSKLSDAKIRLAASKQKSARFGASVYRQMRMLKNFEIEIQYV